MSVRLEDIAKKAGVSVSTVSLALNDKEGVSSDKKNEIRKIAEAMGYTLQDSVEKKNIRFIIFKRHGNVVSDTPFFSRLIEGIQSQSRLKNYDLSISHITYDEENLKDIIKDINEDENEGLLLLATEMLKKDLKYFKNIKKPMVLIDSYFKNENYDYVLINNVNAAYKAALHLINKGHKKIGYLHSSVYINNFRDRQKGFLEALSENSLELKKEYLYEVKSTMEGAYKDTQNLLKKGKKGIPTAFFADNDIIAFGAMKAFKEHGLDVPGDVSIIGFDDMPFCEISNPRLSTIKVFKEGIGKLAVKRLIEKIEGECEIMQKIAVETQLVSRDSVLDLK